MTGKKANNVLEIRAYIKGMWHEVCDTFGEDQMSYRTICRWVAKFRSGQQQLQDAAHISRHAITKTKSNSKKKKSFM